MTIFLLSSISFTRNVRVKGSISKSGKLTVPHYKTGPNKTKMDNWSTKGNVNPMTGEKGYKK